MNFQLVNMAFGAINELYNGRGTTYNLLQSQNIDEVNSEIRDSIVTALRPKLVASLKSAQLDQVFGMEWTSIFEENRELSAHVLQELFALVRSNVQPYLDGIQEIECPSSSSLVPGVTGTQQGGGNPLVSASSSATEKENDETKKLNWVKTRKTEYVDLKFLKNGDGSVWTDFEDMLSIQRNHLTHIFNHYDSKKLPEVFQTMVVTGRQGTARPVVSLQETMTHLLCGTANPAPPIPTQPLAAPPTAPPASTQPTTQPLPVQPQRGGGSGMKAVMNVAKTVGQMAKSNPNVQSALQSVQSQGTDFLKSKAADLQSQGTELLKSKAADLQFQGTDFLKAQAQQLGVPASAVDSIVAQAVPVPETDAAPVPVAQAVPVAPYPPPSGAPPATTNVVVSGAAEATAGSVNPQVPKYVPSSYRLQKIAEEAIKILTNAIADVVGKQSKPIQQAYLNVFLYYLLHYMDNYGDSRMQTHLQTEFEHIFRSFCLKSSPLVAEQAVFAFLFGSSSSSSSSSTPIQGEWSAFATTVAQTALSPQAVSDESLAARVSSFFYEEKYVVALFASYDPFRPPEAFQPAPPLSSHPQLQKPTFRSEELASAPETIAFGFEEPAYAGDLPWPFQQYANQPALLTAVAERLQSLCDKLFEVPQTMVQVYNVINHCAVRVLQTIALKIQAPENHATMQSKARRLLMAQHPHTRAIAVQCIKESVSILGVRVASTDSNGNAVGNTAESPLYVPWKREEIAAYACFLLYCRLSPDDERESWKLPSDVDADTALHTLAKHFDTHYPVGGVSVAGVVDKLDSHLRQFSQSFADITRVSVTPSTAPAPAPAVPTTTTTTTLTTTTPLREQAGGHSAHRTRRRRRRKGRSAAKHVATSFTRRHWC